MTLRMGAMADGATAMQILYRSRRRCYDGPQRPASASARMAAGELAVGLTSVLISGEDALDIVATASVPARFVLPGGN